MRVIATAERRSQLGCALRNGEVALRVDDALLVNLDGQVDLGIWRSLKATQLPAAVRDYLSPRPRMVYFFEPVAPLLPAHSHTQTQTQAPTRATAAAGQPAVHSA